MALENTGTRPVDAAQAFELEALTHWLAAHVEGFEGPLQVEQFQGGQSNPTFKLLTPARSYVMRAKPGPASKLLPSAHAIEREFTVMQALANTPVPVAKMLALCADEQVIGRAFFIMEFVEGRVLWNPGLPTLQAPERAALFDEMNRVIAALHQVNVAVVGLQDFGKPGNYFERQITRWTKQYRASQTGTVTDMEELISWLPAHVPASDETSIVHGDFRLDNLIFDATSSRVLAVLDWELSTLGHPLADFAYHCLAWVMPQGHARGMQGLDLPALGIPSLRDYIARYCERTGRSNGIEGLHFYFAYNLFRLAAILQGIKRRVIDGTASSQQAQQMGDSAPVIAQLAWEFAQRSTFATEQTP
jgi:aminoglycoside phosphotransferase (APT) family kinase protein